MLRLIPSLVILSLLGGCAAPVVKDSLLIQQAASELAKDESQDINTLLDEVRDLQVTAQREDLYFYSPTYIKQADEQLVKADTAIAANLSSQVTLTHILAAKQLLNRGLENKETVLAQLKPALDGIDMLTQINTNSLLSKDFKNIQDDTKDLIILIEQGKNEQSAKELPDLLTDIHKLEIKTLKKTFLTPAEDALEKAEDADAEDFAPVSYSKAKQAIENFENFIEGNATERKVIKERSTQTIHLAQHAYHVAKAVKPLLKINQEQAEQHIFSIEKMLARMGTALNHTSVSHLPLESQSIALAQAAETITKQAQALKNQGQWEKEKQLLEQQIANLKKTQSQPKEIVQAISNASEETQELATPASESQAEKPAIAELNELEKNSIDQTTDSMATTQAPAEIQNTPELDANPLESVEIKPATEVTPANNAVEMTTETP